MKDRRITGFFSLFSRSALFVLAVTVYVASILLYADQPVYSAEDSGDWKDEFEEICSKVKEGEFISVEELRLLIERADKLIAKIQSFNDSTKKVYIFRLKKCRNFFEYMIELRSANESPS